MSLRANARWIFVVSLSSPAACGSAAAVGPTTASSPAVSSADRPNGYETRAQVAVEPPTIPSIEHEHVAIGGNAFHAFFETAVTSFGAATNDRYAYVLGGYHGIPDARSLTAFNRS